MKKYLIQFLLFLSVLGSAIYLIPTKEITFKGKSYAFTNLPKLTDLNAAPDRNSFSDRRKHHPAYGSTATGMNIYLLPAHPDTNSCTGQLPDACQKTLLRKRIRGNYSELKT